MPPLTGNYDLCKRRMNSLKFRLKKDSKLSEQYNDAFLEQSSNYHTASRCSSLLLTITAAIFGNYMLGIFWKLYVGKFFGNYMLENLGECQRLLRGGGGGGIMAQCYGTILRFQGNWTWSAR